MIKLILKLLILFFLLFFSKSMFAFTSSNFLISQSAFKNHDYAEALSNFDLYDTKLSNNKLLDNIISAIITEDLVLANKIASDILSTDPENQEAYIVKLVYFLSKDKLKKIKQFKKELKIKNDFIDFIFFNNNELKDINTISNDLVNIVVSSFSDTDQRSLNYNFLLFYTSLSKIINPENDRATLIKGELYQNVKKEKIARNIFESIDKNSPYYVEAQKSLAYNYSTFLSFQEAVIEINRLLENTDDNYFIKKILADFYRYEKKYNLAIPIYKELISLGKEDLWNLYYMIGICYERLGMWDEAEKNFLISLEIKSDSANVLNYLAYGWVERGIRLNQSLQMLEAAYKANPDSYYIIDSLAWAHFKKNNLDEAARLMEKVIDMAPGEAISLDHLGDIYYAMDRKREAIHFWQQALELAEPEDEIEQSVQNKLDKFNAG